MSKAIKFRTKDNEPVYPCPYFPVGSIYISVSSTNPTEWFGGSWEQIKGRFLLGVGSPSDNTDNYFGAIGNKSYNAGVGSTGGQSNHTLTINEMPSHTHYYDRPRWWYAESYNSGSGSIIANESSTTEHSVWQNVGNTGGNQAHNNMPPYFAVYIWRRIS